jgi:hypothetical protein
MFVHLRDGAVFRFAWPFFGLPWKRGCSAMDAAKLYFVEAT